MAFLLRLAPQKISIHALREEGDRPVQSVTIPAPIFLSTPSARRATEVCKDCPADRDISIHALREEGDHPVKCPGSEPC